MEISLRESHNDNDPIPERSMKHLVPMLTTPLLAPLAALHAAD
jgi:hypothetical protein